MEINIFQMKLGETRPKESSLEKEVRLVLQNVRSSFQQQIFLNDLYWVDFYDQNSNTVLEVDGPDHDGKKGSDRFKQRQLEALGYRIVRLSNKDWNASKNKEELLANLLGAASEINQATPQSRQLQIHDEPTEAVALDDIDQVLEVVEDMESDTPVPKTRRRKKRKAKPISESPKILEQAVQVNGVAQKNEAKTISSLRIYEVSTLEPSDLRQSHTSIKAVLLALGALATLGAAYYISMNATHDE